MIVLAVIVAVWLSPVAFFGATIVNAVRADRREQR